MISALSITCLIQLAARRGPQAVARGGAACGRHEQDGAKREVSLRLGLHIKRLRELRSLPPCEACALAQGTLRAMDAEGLSLNVDGYNQAISMCSSDLPAANALFERIFSQGKATEATFASMLRVQVTRPAHARARSHQQKDAQPSRRHRWGRARKGRRCRTFLSSHRRSRERIVPGGTTSSG